MQKKKFAYEKPTLKIFFEEFDTLEPETLHEVIRAVYILLCFGESLKEAGMGLSSNPVKDKLEIIGAIPKLEAALHAKLPEATQKILDDMCDNFFTKNV